MNLFRLNNNKMDWGRASLAGNFPSPPPIPALPLHIPSVISEAQLSIFGWQDAMMSLTPGFFWTQEIYFILRWPVNNGEDVLGKLIDILCPYLLKGFWTHKVYYFKRDFLIYVVKELKKILSVHSVTQCHVTYSANYMNFALIEPNI